MRGLGGKNKKLKTDNRNQSRVPRLALFYFLERMRAIEFADLSKTAI